MANYGRFRGRRDDPTRYLREALEGEKDDAVEAFCILMDWEYTPDDVIDCRKVGPNVFRIFTDSEEFDYDYEEDCLLSM